MAYSDTELLAALREYAAEHGTPPKVSEANDKEGFPSAMTFINHFGSWNAAVEAAGLDTRNRRRTDEELLADLRELAERRGEIPSATAVRDHENMASPPTYKNRFGSWNAALAAAGLPAFGQQSYSADDLVEALQRLADELGRPPRSADLIGDPSAPNPPVYIARFGSWNEALAAADLATYGYSDAELLSILRELAADLDRQPKVEDIVDDETLPSVTAFADHFGAWSDAVSTALAHSENDEEPPPISAIADGDGKQADE